MTFSELILTAVLFLTDIFSKSFMESLIARRGRIELIRDFFALDIVHNTGAAWGMFSGRTELFFMMTILVVGIILYVLFNKETARDRWFRIPLIMALAGTLGNFFDRVVYGYVRDFLDFTIFTYDYPVFNIADSLLCVGFFLLAVYIIRHDGEQ